MKKFAVTPALTRLYREAWDTQGIWLKEYGLNSEGLCIALAGTRKRLTELERQIGREIEWPEFQYHDGIKIGAERGLGSSRIVACRRAIRAVFDKRIKETS